jgi:hypothetical protein
VHYAPARFPDERDRLIADPSLMELAVDEIIRYVTPVLGFIRTVTTAWHNYDMGSLYLEEDGTWRLIAPTETGPQPYNTGGEMAMWVSRDQGESWRLEQQLTRDSEYNHSFARRPVDAHPEFYAFWADGHGRRPSESRLYFADRAGNVFQLPVRMTEEMEKPIPIP